MVLVHTLFMISESGDVFLEKHYQTPLPKTVLDPFIEQLREAPFPEDVPPIMSHDDNFLLSIYRDRVFVLVVCRQDVPPLSIFEFLHRVVDILTDYFKHFTAEIVRQNAVVVYEVLEEVMDNGFPLSTENNVLKELVKAPTILRAAKRAIGMGGGGNMSQQLPSSQLSNIPWRKSDVWYPTNDIYVDVVEEVDCTLARNGNPIGIEIRGRVQCNSQLSGVPDLIMSFNHPRMLTDVSLHPCVRIRKWQQENILSFIPPDGRFKLMTYVTEGAQAPIPLQINPLIKFNGKGAEVDIQVSRRHALGDKPCEDVQLSFQLFKGIGSVNLIPNHGTFSYDPLTHTVNWMLRKVPSGTFYSLKGNITLLAGVVATSAAPTVRVHFKVPGQTLSGISITGLEVYNEKYKPFKGVKYIASAGKFVVRSR